MIDLFRAEWAKITGHRAAMFWLLGLFPICALIFFVMTAFAATRPAAAAMIESSLSHWGDLAMLAWRIPSNFFGRLFLLAFTAFAFAGEAQWGTWKNLTPRSSRSRIVLVKFFVVSLLVILTFVVLSIIVVLGGVVLTRLAGVPIGPELDRSAIAGIGFDYTLGALLAFLAFLITSIFAALGAIWTRTVLGGTLAGMVAVFIDPALLYGSRYLARLLEMPAVLQIQRLSPWYNIENVRAWMTERSPTNLIAESFTALDVAPPVDTTPFSLAVLSVWVVLGVAATVVLFERQDITC